MSQFFECLVPIDHTADHYIYPVGTVIKLDHLAPDKVKLLIERGYVKLVKTEAKAEAKAETKG